jgi:hypothetical protein
MQLVRFNQFLPVALNHEPDLMLKAAEAPLFLAIKASPAAVGAGEA